MATISDSLNQPVASSPANMQKKREGCLEWDDTFMGAAFLFGLRSKDPSSQVGAAIVNADKRLISTGYNGMPNGCSDDKLPWGRVGSPLETKHLYVCHAELNALNNCKSASVHGATIYVTLFPCSDCAKNCIQAGIKEVVYLSDKYKDRPTFQASRNILEMAGVKIRQYIPSKPIVLDFSQMDPKLYE